MLNSLILSAWLTGSTADLVSTEKALASCRISGLCREANPIYKLPPAPRVAIRTTVTVTGGVLVWKGLRSQSRTVRWGTAIGASIGAAWYFRVSVRNMKAAGLR